MSIQRETDMSGVTGVTPKSVFGLPVRAAIGWRYSAGDAMARRLDVNELLDRVAQAQWCYHSENSPGPAGFAVREGASEPQELTQLDLLGRVAEAANAYTLSEIRGIDQSLDLIKAEFGLATMDYRRRLRELTAEMLALHHAQEMDAPERAALLKMEGRITELEAQRRTTLKSVTAKSALIGFIASSLEKSNIVAALTDWGPIFVRSTDLVGAALVSQGQWDAHLLPAIEEAARRGGIAVDAGAHYGVISCMLATKFRAVHAFEANSDTYKILSLNAFLRDNITCHNLALSDQAGPQSLSIAQEQDLPEDAEKFGDNPPLHPNVGSLSFSRHGGFALPVQGIALDSLDLTDVAFIKVDCQGADGLVLSGAMKTITRCRPYIVFEWEAELAKHYNLTLEQIFDNFSKLDYEVSILKSHNHKQTDFIAKPKEV